MIRCPKCQAANKGRMTCGACDAPLLFADDIIVKPPPAPELPRDPVDVFELALRSTCMTGMERIGQVTPVTDMLVRLLEEFEAGTFVEQTIERARLIADGNGSG